MGFTTQKVMELEINGCLIHGVFSGDTIIHKSYWGELELFKAWADFWFRFLRNMMNSTGFLSVRDIKHIVSCLFSGMSFILVITEKHPKICRR